jgi:hypothetical protein
MNYHIYSLHSNHKHLKPTPRTFREAFGHSYQHEHDSSSRAWVVIIIGAAALLLMGVV